MIAGIGYAIAYGFNNAWPLIVSVGAGTFVVAKRGRRLRMSQGWTVAYITTAALLGGLLSMPTWLLTGACACAQTHSAQATVWRQPPCRLAGDLRDAVVVPVVVQDDCASGFGGRGDEQVGMLDGPL